VKFTQVQCKFSSSPQLNTTAVGYACILFAVHYTSLFGGELDQAE